MMVDDNEIAAFLTLIATCNEKSNWTEGGDLPQDLRQSFPWFKGSVVATGKCTTILFDTERKWFLSYLNYEEMSLIYLGNDAGTSWKVFNNNADFGNAPYCDLFEAQLVSASTWRTFQELYYYVEEKRETYRAEDPKDARIEELTQKLLEINAGERLSSYIVYSVGQWMTKLGSRLNKHCIALFTSHMGTVQRNCWPREFTPKCVQETMDISHYAASEYSVFTQIHRHPWPHLDSVDAGLICQWQLGFDGHLTPQMLELLRECTTRHQMHAPFHMTLWRATSAYDGVNPMLAFTISRASAQKFLKNQGFPRMDTIAKLEISAGTPIFPVVVYADGFKSEGEILVPSDVARTSLVQHAAIIGDMKEEAAVDLAQSISSANRNTNLASEHNMVGLYQDFPTIHKDVRLNKLCFNSTKGYTDDVARYAVAIMRGRLMYRRPTWYRFTGVYWRVTLGPDELLARELVGTYEIVKLKCPGEQKARIQSLILDLVHLDTRKRYIKDMERIVMDCEKQHQPWEAHFTVV